MYKNGKRACSAPFDDFIYLSKLRRFDSRRAWKSMGPPEGPWAYLESLGDSGGPWRTQELPKSLGDSGEP
ncbi:hypothetical protein ACRALDRAFT_204925 [Sodiomyces alcalophilus JCM 7366]|uniref:uncharacterized protein n=1 Tax=Sodiomyces alcalophilus JCM 7366 TaxID=591952 RepID=UPI0039B62544